MNISDTQLSHRKRVRDDNPSSLSSPELNSDKKKTKKRKRKNEAQGDLIQVEPVPSTQSNEKGAEQNEQLHSCPNPNSVIPEKEQGAESNGVTAATPQKRKRRKNKNKNEALGFSEGEQTDAMQVGSEQTIDEEKNAESCEVKVRAVQPQVCHKHRIVNPVVQEKGDFVELKEPSAEKPQVCNKQEYELLNKVVEPRKENEVGKNEGATENPELVSVPDSAPLKDTPRKNRKKKEENVLRGEGEKPTESINAEHPEVCSKPESASPIHTQHVIPIVPEVPSEPEQNLSKKKRRKKKRRNNVLNNEAEEPDKHNSEEPDKHNSEEPDKHNSEEPDKHNSEEPDKHNSEEPDKHNSEEPDKHNSEQPEKHNSEQPEIQVQRSICPIVASETDQTISIDQKLSTDSAAPIDEKRKMSMRKRQKKRKSALKQEGSESDKHNSESTAEFHVSKDNVEKPVMCNGAPHFECHGESSRNAVGHKSKGHKSKDRSGYVRNRLPECPDNLQVCFFCGEVGHTLAKCSVSQAGGRFAWCVLCYSHGHFTNKCPLHGYGIWN